MLVSETRFIHACERCGVIDVPLTPAWPRRIASAFRFPHPENGHTMSMTGVATARTSASRGKPIRQ
jgi:hypothetical protein